MRRSPKATDLPWDTYMEMALGHFRWTAEQLWSSTPLELASALRWDVRRRQIESDAAARASGRLTQSDREELEELWRQKTGTDLRG